MTVTPAELADTLVQRFRAEREAAEARAEEIRRLVSEWARVARSAGLIRNAWLIGSLAWGTFGARSDVDIVVEGLPEDREAEVWAELVERLRAEVDLLTIESLPESFARRVRERGLVLV